MDICRARRVAIRRRCRVCGALANVDPLLMSEVDRANPVAVTESRLFLRCVRSLRNMPAPVFRHLLENTP